MSILFAAFFLAAWVTSDDKTVLVGALATEAAPALVEGVEDVEGTAPALSDEELVEAGGIGWPPFLASEAAPVGAMERWLEDIGSLLRVKLILLLTVMVVAWNATFTSRGLYNSRRLESRLSESLDVLRASALGSLVVLVLANAVYQEIVKINPPLANHLRAVENNQWQFLIVFFILASGATIIARLVIRHVLEQARLRGRNLRAVLIVGTNHRALGFAKAIEAKPQMGYYVAGFVDEEWDGIAGFKKGGHKLVASLKGLGEYLADSVIDEVVVALPVSSAYIYSSRIVSLCQEQGITVRFISQIFDSRLAKGRLEVFGGEPMLSLEASPDEGFNRLIKKIIDRVAAAALLTVSAPLFGAVAVAIKILDPGPVFFAQTRVGHNKRRFKLFK
ncbi:MAG: sugar transferase, partial [Acidobacteriota bacterium]